jgi:epoxyqueuosine reductase
MKAAIVQRALELGFDACRFTSADAPAHKEHFEAWLAAGNHGEMGYLLRNAEKRVDPRKVLADAQTIIVLGVSYFGAGAGAIARYARFTDYHDVIAERLKELAAFVNSFDATARALWYVDTGPFLERELAARAGLGFVGKHTNLIGRDLGNWFFLAEIITTLQMVVDPPESSRCGKCTRCLTACPTNAITAPYQLDARRCISYLTIELKGSIPEDLRPAIGNRIYGCDDCLQACPWNRFAREGRMMKPHTRFDLDTPDLLELLALDDAGFKRRMAGTPIIRTKRRGLLRNVCVALGNTGDRSALPALERATLDKEPLVAEHARWAIQQIEARTTRSHEVEAVS